MTRSIQLRESKVERRKGVLAAGNTASFKAKIRLNLGDEQAATRLSVVASLSAIIVAIVLWTMALRSVDVSHMTDFGLVSVLPVTAYLALLILTLSFALVVHQRQAPVAVLLLHVTTLIVLIHGTPNILYGTLRYSWAWKHVGIVDYIQRFGSVDPGIDYLNVYHNWPGFFALNALITEVAGLQSALSYAGWAPVFFNLLDLGALLLIFRTNTQDQRLIWLGIWFFYLANWIGQDYFSPQAMSYFLYLVVIGICLRWFKTATLPSKSEIQRWLVFDKVASVYRRLIGYTTPDDSPQIVVRPVQRLGLLTIIALISIVIASSHQLTPFMLVSALVALVVSQRLNARTLPIIVAVLTGTWAVYVAVEFMRHGNVLEVIQSIGRLFGNFNANFIDLSLASPGQKTVALMSRALTLGVGVLALLGGARRLRQGYWDLPFILLMMAPVPLVAANSYGGEMLFRIYYFALPFMAFLAAAILYPRPTLGISWKTVALTAALSIMLLVGFFFAYYGKERMFYFSKDEVAAADYLYDAAPNHSLIVDATVNFPWSFKNYEYYSYMSLTEMSRAELINLTNDPVDGLADLMNDENYSASYLIITRSQKANVEMVGLMPAGSLDRIEQSLERSPKFKLIYANQDAQIFTLAHGTTNSIDGGN